MNGVDMDLAEKEIMNILGELSLSPAGSYELEKVKNKFEANTVMANTNILNKATNLCLYEMLGDAEMMNREIEAYRSVTAADVITAAGKYIRKTNCSTLYYRSIKQ